MQEPISHFYNTNGIDPTHIQKIVCGEKYVALLLKNGNIGVCSTLHNKMNVTIEDLENIDITSIPHRAIAVAYFNALFNYGRQYKKQIDIFDEIDFRKYRNIAMIGFFGSLTEKFKKASINLSIFDLKNNNHGLIDIKGQKQFLAVADVVILTSTSVLNNTFLDIIKSTSENCKVFILGPSTILHADMFKYRNIHTIFGSVFKNNDSELLNIIRNGGGTKSFMYLMNKVCFEN